MLSYDRRVHPKLIAVLSAGGWAHSLVEYGRSGQYALDLQLRGYAGKQSCWATLYVGLTKVLDLHFHPARGFRLDVNAAWKPYGWDPAWDTFRADFRAEWSRVEDYLENAIRHVGDKFLVEGTVQSAVSAFRSQDLAVIDREVVVGFSSQPEKTAVSESLAAPLLAAVGTSEAPWWKGKPAKLGGECDALAIAPDGAVLAIEIKPSKASTTIPWAPLQVRHYCNLLSQWAAETPEATAILQGMIDQRVAIGLLQNPPQCAAPFTVHPVLAIQRGPSAEVIRRMRLVQGLLRDAGHDDPPLRTFSVNLVGRLDPL